MSVITKPIAAERKSRETYTCLISQISYHKHGFIRYRLSLSPTLTTSKLAVYNQTLSRSELQIKQTS